MLALRATSEPQLLPKCIWLCIILSDTQKGQKLKRLYRVPPDSQEDPIDRIVSHLCRAIQTSLLPTAGKSLQSLGTDPEEICKEKCDALCGGRIDPVVINKMGEK